MKLEWTMIRLRTKLNDCCMINSWISRAGALFILLLSHTAMAQDSIPPVAQDTTSMDTIVIRSTQEPIKLVPRGVRLVHPVAAFHKTKPLRDKYKRFTPPTFWSNQNKLGINMNEVAFVNWNAGGNNSFSASGNMDFVRNYKFRYLSWNNEINFKYGLNAQEGRKLRKTDDAMRLSSTFGYRKDTITNWYYSVKANFNSQFTDGYKYPDRDHPISRFMAPGYLFVGAGTSYITEDQFFNLYISPITQKSTFVLDQTLANQGAFGVKKAVYDADGNIIKEGENTYTEFGFLVTNSWKANVGKNILMDNRVSLYTDYLHSFGNVDVDWEMNLTLKVNQYVNANIGTHVLFDDDIKFDEVKDADGMVVTPGETRIQFKQLLGVGIAYNF